jgi:hypothetical protein
MAWDGWADFDPAAHERAVREQGNPTRKPQKYHAQPVTVDGIRFASKREARRWEELKVLERAGQIKHLERQPPILLHAPGGIVVGKYLADFRYFDCEKNRTIVEDSKGVRTAIYRWKARHVTAEYGITIQEV